MTIGSDSITEAHTMRKALFLLFLTLIPVSVDLWKHYHPAPQALSVPVPLAGTACGWWL